MPPTASTTSVRHAAAADASFYEKINTVWHERANWIFAAIVIGHWGEHLLQAWQIYVLGWPVPEARGALGYFFPALISSEALHYGYAVVMLIGLWVLRPGFTEVEDRRWWTVALAIQFFHHFEHFLLLAQRVTGYNIFDRPVPTSIAQLWIPRVELHLFYNTIVFLPMVVAMYFHMFPPARAGRPACTCAWDRKVSPAAV
jgi:hypothetical protein